MSRPHMDGSNRRYARKACFDVESTNLIGRLRRGDEDFLQNFETSSFFDHQKSQIESLGLCDSQIQYETL